MDYKLDTVGVAGSIPVEPTILNPSNSQETIEIPGNFDVIPAIEFRAGRFRLFRVLSRNQKKKCDFSVTERRVKKAR